MISYESILNSFDNPSTPIKFTEKIDILRLHNELGWTIAHAQSRRGWKTEDKDILKWATIQGYTVAHCQAFHGHVFTSKRINKMKTKT